MKVVNWQDEHIYLHKLTHTFGIVFDIRNVSVSLYCLHIYKQIPGCIYTC